VVLLGTNYVFTAKYGLTNAEADKYARRIRKTPKGAWK